MVQTAVMGPISLGMLCSPCLPVASTALAARIVQTSIMGLIISSMFARIQPEASEGRNAVAISVGRAVPRGNHRRMLDATGWRVLTWLPTFDTMETGVKSTRGGHDSARAMPAHCSPRHASTFLTPCPACRCCPPSS